MTNTSIPRTTLATLAFLVCTTNAIASEGAVEINQTCAVQTGCFPFDTPGFPIRINSSPGIHIVLTSDLVVPDANTTAILIEADEVNIDLNQFAIRRADCTTTVAGCTIQTGTGSGIDTLLFDFEGLRVTNGSIFGMGNDGIDGGQRGVVSGVRAFRNGDSGITMTGRLTNNISFENGGTGISAGLGSQVEGNVVRANGSHGLQTSDGLVSANTASLNTTFGFLSSGSTMHAANNARANQNHGFSMGLGSTLVDSSASSNLGNGINVFVGGHVRGSLSHSNTGAGLSLSLNASYRDSVSAANGAAAVVSGLNMGGNTCDGTLTCP